MTTTQIESKIQRLWELNMMLKHGTYKQGKLMKVVNERTKIRKELQARSEEMQKQVKLIESYLRD